MGVTTDQPGHRVSRSGPPAASVVAPRVVVALSHVAVLSRVGVLSRMGVLSRVGVLSFEMGRGNVVAVLSHGGPDLSRERNRYRSVICAGANI